MTREEKKKAIDALKISVPIMAITQEEFADYIKALNKIMDWLEQEPILDKIRAEIVERRHLYQINEVSIEHSSANGTQALTWVLEIIDKYTTESEET